MENNIQTVKEITKKIEGYTLPRWNELPDFDIYMDQVISLITKYFEGYPGYDAKGLTPSMVNNYVKQGIIPPPNKKKYTREHLAYLIIIYVLKPVIPISLIGTLIDERISGKISNEELYNRFCDLFDKTILDVTESVALHKEKKIDIVELVFCSALRAYAEQTIALGLLDSLDIE